MGICTSVSSSASLSPRSLRVRQLYAESQLKEKERKQLDDIVRRKFRVHSFESYNSIRQQEHEHEQDHDVVTVNDTNHNTNKSPLLPSSISTTTNNTKQRPKPLSDIERDVTSRTASVYHGNGYHNTNINPIEDNTISPTIPLSRPSRISRSMSHHNIHHQQQQHMQQQQQSSLHHHRTATSLIPSSTSTLAVPQHRPRNHSHPFTSIEHVLQHQLQCAQLFDIKCRYVVGNEISTFNVIGIDEHMTADDLLSRILATHRFMTAQQQYIDSTHDCHYHDDDHDNDDEKIDLPHSVRQQSIQHTATAKLIYNSEVLHPHNTLRSYHMNASIAAMKPIVVTLLFSNITTTV